MLNKLCTPSLKLILITLVSLSLIFSVLDIHDNENESYEIVDFTVLQSNKVKTDENSFGSLVIAMCRDVENMMTVKQKKIRLLWKRQEEQFLTMLASLLYFTNLPKVNIILLTDSLETSANLIALLEKWPSEQRDRLSFEIREIETERFKMKMLSQWRPCAWTKMFIPDMLHDYDSIIYVDSDIVFLGPVEDMWNIFTGMNDRQSIAAAPELWYIEEGRIRPMAGKYGINTGVLALNLTRLRTQFPDGFGNTLQKLQNFEPEARHDQDVLNAFLKDHPEMLLELTARYNFLPSSCLKYAPLCEECLERGILALHGADSTFYRLVDAKTRVSYKDIIYHLEFFRSN